MLGLGLLLLDLKSRYHSRPVEFLTATAILISLLALVELAITPIRLGDVFSFSAFVRDISQRNRAEEAMRRTEDLYRRAITAANAVPYLSDSGLD